MFFRIDACEIHLANCEMFFEILKNKCNKVTYKQERTLVPGDYEDKTMVISLGGDGCFLRTQSMINHN